MKKAAAAILLFDIMAGLLFLGLYGMEGKMLAADSSLVLTEEEGLEYLTNIHHLTHLGPKKMTELVNRSPYHIPRLQKAVEDLVKNC